MTRGALIFVGVLFSLACSWAALIFGSQLHLGALQPAAILNSSELYPAPRPGLAQQGAVVYRANGCFYCHSQQVRQGGITFGAVITDPGTNASAVVAALRARFPSVSADTAQQTPGKLPVVIAADTTAAAANQAMKPFTDIEVKTELTFKNLGADIAAGLGPRGSVARDYLFDNPPLPGSLRAGPDLANVGSRAPEKFVGIWSFSPAARTNDALQAIERERHHLAHLYNPAAVAKGSTMPAYPFLFEKRPLKPGAKPSPDAIQLGKDTPSDGFEIIPSSDAKALVAYLLSLRHDASLAERAVPRPPRIPTPSTNAAPSAPAPKP